MFDQSTGNRYDRQLQLAEFGSAGQQKLQDASVLVIGAGGLGCPVLQYLAGAGIGTIGIADDDIVSLDNLHRQTIYTTHDIGSPKAIKAAAFIAALNPEIRVNTYQEKLTVNNAFAVIEPYSIVVDGTDSFAARYMINDACVLMNKPLVYGAVSKFECQVAVFNHYSDKTGEYSSNYRDLFATPPADTEIPNCSEAGILGITPGITGLWMAAEVIKLATGLGTPPVNQVFIYNVLNNQAYNIRLLPGKRTQQMIPENRTMFEQMDYPKLCSRQPSTFEIDPVTFDRILQEDITIVDVRETGELPVVTDFHYVNIPAKEIEKNLDLLVKTKIVLFCQSGKRSLEVARLLSGIFGKSKDIYSLEKGILYWKQYKHEKQKT